MNNKRKSKKIKGNKKISVRAGVLAAGLLTNMLASDPSLFAEDRPYFQGDSLAYLQNYFGIKSAAAMGPTLDNPHATFHSEGINVEGSGFSIMGSEGGGENPGLTYDIDVTQISYVSSALTEGYAHGTQESKEITITRTGTGTLANLRTELSGPQAGAFTVSQPLLSALDSSTPSTTFQVKANDGLSVGNYSVTATVYATNMTPVSFTVSQTVYESYRISPLVDQTATTLTEGYAAGTQDTKEITINRMGTGTLANLRTELSGPQAGAFTVSQPLLSALDSSTPSTTFQVKANDGLSVGNYSVTATVYATNMTPVSFTVSQTVAAPLTYSITPLADQTATTLTEGYAAGTQDTEVITINRMGTGTLANLRTELSGPQAGAFTISQPTVTELNSSISSTTFQVKANNGLSSGTYTVTASVYASNMTPVSFTVTQQVYAPDVIPPTTIQTGSTQPSSDVIVLVNGKPESAGTLTTRTEGDRVISTVAVDPKKLEEKLNEAGTGATITIPITGKSDIGIGELNGQMILNMERKQADLELKTDQATYTIPAGQINIEALSQRFGTGVDLQSLKVQVEVAKPTKDMVKIVESAASNGEFSIVVPPLEFTVRAIYQDRVVEVNHFEAYVERTIAVPEGVDPNKITTGIVVDPDGTVRHVPTKVIVIEGKYYVQVNSLSNSTYSVVWHPREFADVTRHWAKNAVNDMGSRMVLNGVTEELFLPDQVVTRAEFAAMLIRGLGIKTEVSAQPFRDVLNGNWYYAYVATANAYHMITGVSDDTFAPDTQLTREQAMVMIANAMHITGLSEKLPTPSEEELLRPFEDRGLISSWAKSSVLLNLQAGLISGRTETQLAPQALMTRAEVATLVQRLLKQSGLI